LWRYNPVEWWFIFMILFVGLLILFAAGLPIAFGFLLINLIGIFFFMRGILGLQTVTLYIYNSLASFTLMPVPLFILMGEVLFNSGVSTKALDAIDKWIGRVPGRLALLAVASGVLFAVLSGSAIASAATLGALLVPEMTRRRYSKHMSIGPILASGQLAVIIPPSILIVVMGSLADISIGKLLIAGVIPGLVVAAFFSAYIVGRCSINPSLAPPFEATHAPLMEKLKSLITDVMPLSLIIFLVLGLIFLGIATPSEASGLGALGAFVLSILYRRLNIKVVKKSVVDATRTTSSILLVLSGSMAFSQLLSYTGASRGFVKFATALPLSPMLIVIGMLFVIVLLGTFIDQISIIMIAAPLYFPIVRVLGLDPLWFGIVILITIELGVKTPPFGILLFVMKGVTPPDTTMSDIYQAAFPYIILELMAIGLLMAVPQIVLWLPRLMS